MSHVVLGECGKFYWRILPLRVKNTCCLFSEYAEIIKITQKCVLPFNNALRI
jgi:hypothetical protein